MSIILGITGLAGSGKSTTANYVYELGWKLIRLGDITETFLKKEQLAINEKNEKIIRAKLTKEYGLGAYAILSLDLMKTHIQKKHNIVIDGIYSWEEVKILKNNFHEKFRLLALLCNPKKRYSRLQKRKIRNLNEKEAYSRDFHELEQLNKGTTIAMADFYIINENNIEQLKNNIQLIMEQI